MASRPIRPAMGLARIILVATGVALVGLALLLPGLINGFPLLFPDSIGYFHAGEAALNELARPFAAALPHGAGESTAPSLADRASDTVSTARSVYYGAFFVAAYRLFGMWGLPVAQALIVAVSLALAARTLLGFGPLRAAAMTAAVALLGGLGIFAVAVMPDVFAGLMVLGLVVMLTARDRTGRGERAWWLGVIALSCLFHKAILVLAAVLLAGFAIASVARRRRLGVVAAPALVVAIAFVGHSAVGMVVERLTNRPPVEMSFLLSRVIGDHTADAYLRDACPQVRLGLCRFVDRLPMSTDEFLWSTDPARGVLELVTPAERRTIAAQAGTVVWGAVRTSPGAQLRASLGNFLAQLVDVGAAQYNVGPNSPPDKTPGLRPLLLDYRASAVAHKTMPLAAAGVVMTAVYLAALAVVAVVGWRLRGRPGVDRDRVFAVLGLLVAGIVLNAAISGVVAGNYDRYQGRIAWLALFAAIYAVTVSRRTPERRPIG